MRVDLRDKIKKEKKMKELPKNHRAVFEQKLQNELHKDKSTNHSFLKIAASIIFIIGLGIALQQYFKTDKQHEVAEKEVKSDTKLHPLADVSPNLKKVEDFYLTRINYQIARITITDENKDLLEIYLAQLGALQKEYSDLNTQLTNQKEISENLIDDLIENLQLRLQLMMQLRKKLEIIEINKSKENESKQA